MHDFGIAGTLRWAGRRLLPILQGGWSAVAVASVIAPTAFAGSIEYDYVGSNLTSVRCHGNRGDCTPQLLPSRITGHIIVDSAFPPSSIIPNPVIKSFSFTDGVNTFSSSQGTVIYPYGFETDATGDFTYYDLTFGGSVPNLTGYGMSLLSFGGTRDYLHYYTYYPNKANPTEVDEISANNVISGFWTPKICLTAKGNTGSCQPLAPHIFFNGVDVTADPSKAVAVVGQQITLSASVAGITPVWKPDPADHVIGGYAATVSSASTFLPILTGPSTTFYWTIPGAHNVSYTYVAPDNTVRRAKTTFNVTAPTAPNLTNVSNFVSQITGNLLSCGGGTITNACAHFNAYLVPPQGEINSTAQFIQLLVYFYDDVTVSGGGKWHCSFGGGYDLDSTFPYIAVGKSSGGQIFAWDSPDLGLTGSDLPNNSVAHKLSFRARMYLMWRSQISNAIAVPMGYIDWEWNASVKRAPSGGQWILRPPLSGARNGIFKASVDYPTWSGVTSSDTPAQCTKVN